MPQPHAMNRRKFLGLLAAAPAVVVAAKYLKPEPRIPIRYNEPMSKAEQEAFARADRLNPAWVNAPYEVAFAFDPRHYHGDLKWHFVPDALPLRYSAAGEIVPTFIRS